MEFFEKFPLKSQRNFQIQIFFEIVQIAKMAFFCTFSKKLKKKEKVGQLQQKYFCGEYLLVVSTSPEKMFYVEAPEDLKKYS